MVSSALSIRRRAGRAERAASVEAARALQAATGCALGVDIQVSKRIPQGAGVMAQPMPPLPCWDSPTVGLANRARHCSSQRPVLVLTCLSLCSVGWRWVGVGERPACGHDAGDRLRAGFSRRRCGDLRT